MTPTVGFMEPEPDDPLAYFRLGGSGHADFPDHQRRPALSDYDDYDYDERDIMDDDCDYDDDLIDGVGFAVPGGRSALRAATPENPRNLPCPSCGREDVLTAIDIAHGYQCNICADQAERGF